MSILTGPAIHAVVERSRAMSKELVAVAADWEFQLRPFIDIDPFDPARCGPNSYDVTLADKLLVYQIAVRGLPVFGDALEADKDNRTTEVDLSLAGRYCLQPGVLYLGSTVERTKCAGVVPWLDGRSSVGRLGISVHVTAGRGDDGYGMDTPHGCTWTLEITTVHPVWITPGMRIAQLSFFSTVGERKPYQGRYSRQDGPVASRLWQTDPS